MAAIIRILISRLQRHCVIYEVDAWGGVKIKHVLQKDSGFIFPVFIVNIIKKGGTAKNSKSAIIPVHSKTSLQYATPKLHSKTPPHKLQSAVSGYMYLACCSELKFCLFGSQSTIFSHVGTEPPLPDQYFLGGKCILLKDTTRRPE